jgi:hypothetical protein
MSQYTSYYLYQKFEKRGGQDWLPVYPNVYSADGDGTMSPVIKQENDSACGYTPPAEPQYRWVNLDPATDYYCVECGGSVSTKVSGTYGESGETFETSCSDNYSHIVETSDVPTGVTYAKVGTCATEIWGPYNSQGVSHIGPFQSKPGLSGVSIPSTVTSIGASAFTNSNALVDCILPDTITTIPTAAFSGCTSLSNFVLWNTVTSIGDSAFTNCDSLVSINIPSGLTRIPPSCFYDCGALSEVTIPSGVTSIGAKSFMFCSGLTQITCLATTPPTLGASAFTNTDDCPIYVPCESANSYRNTSGWSIYASRIHGIPPCEEPKKFIGTYARYSRPYNLYCNSSTTLTSGETRPYTSSTQYYIDITNAIIGECVTTLGTGVFRGCDILSSITIPNSVINIGDYAFSSCSGLTNITIPDSVTNIGEYAFFHCRRLSNITIPSGVTNIGDWAFASCTGLTSITCLATTPPTLGNYQAFYDTNNCPIYVPAGSVDTYKAASGWKSYTSRIQPITS